MFVLGITGPSGAGKGTASEFLKEKGFYHIDTDRLVPSVYPKAIPELVAAFGPQVVTNGAVNKKELARAAFATSQDTETLNKILHPLVMEKVSEMISNAEKSGFLGVVVDGAALLEAHGEKVCDKMLCILAPKELRMKRVILRDSIDQTAAKMRLDAQKPDSYYVNGSNAVIVNENIEQMKRDLNELLKEWNI